MTRQAHIIGWGSYLPERVLTNHDLARFVETSDEWIVSRTGIRERRIASSSENTTSMAIKAATTAVEVGDIDPTDIELIIVATSTAENVFPSTATQVQDYLGASRAGAFDLAAACSGFVYGLSMAADSIAAGTVSNALVVGSEVLSRVTDWSDRATCILFGDGAGAVLLAASDQPGGVLATALHSDGSGGNLLRLRSQISKAGAEPGAYPRATEESFLIEMKGRRVFRFATRVMTDSIEEVLAKAGLSNQDVDLVVPHQANRRIIETSAKKLKIPADRFYTNLERVGNTSAASIPLALCEAIENDRLKPNDKVVVVGFGGGLTWAAAVIQWDAIVAHVPLWKREWRLLLYFMARVRSLGRRFGRWVSSAVSRSPFRGARLRDADK